MATFPYPPAPPQSKEIKPSAEFRKAAVKVTVAIMLFFIVYLFLVIAAVGLAVLCFYIAAWVFGALTNFLGLAAGLGLIAVGISVIFFLVKFIFSSSKNEDPSRIRIHEHEQPELFAFIRQLAIDTKTRFPKKIFISPAVNACVFYNSNFWSMFFPVKKNLEIGLGLVNSVNISEFKAIMAHEFGHFSQQSMKLGSFTYNVNRIIYNMLYENSGYSRLINGWASIDGVFGFFAHITIGIAKGIQGILRGMYQFINKHYMGLSRQMEYNADAIAANVAGANNLVNSLNRLDLSQSSYDTVIQKAEEFLKQRKKSSNIFSDHTAVMLGLAAEFKLPVEHGLPQVTTNFLGTFSKSRINFKDQWASHPANEEREAELQQLGLEAATDTRSAWILFSDAPQLQQRVTAHVYADVPNKDELQEYDNDTFHAAYTDELERYRLPEVFNKYYNNRFIETAGWQEETWHNDASATAVNIQEILTDENSQLPEMVRNNEKDIETLNAIAAKTIDVNSFDFDGVKYDRSSATDIIQQIQKEVDAQKEKLAAIDKALYKAACHRALGKGMQHATLVQESLKKYCDMNSAAAAMFELCGTIMENITPFYNGNVSLDEVNSRVNVLRNDHEIQLKARLKELLSDQHIAAHLPGKLKADMEEFITKAHAYFMGNEFQNDELQNLIYICNEVTNVLGEIKWTAYKHLLVQQASVY